MLLTDFVHDDFIILYHLIAVYLPRPGSAQTTKILVLGLLMALASAIRPGSLHMPTSDNLNEHTDMSFPSRCPGCQEHTLDDLLHLQQGTQGMILK